MAAVPAQPRSASRHLTPQHSKPQTILEYLSQAMTTEELNELYKDKFTTLTLFRTLPTLAKQYLIRLTLLSPLTPVPRSLITSWHYSSITKQDGLINQDALHCMVALKLLVKYNLPTPPPAQIPTASLIQSPLPQNELHFYLNPYFHTSLQSALASTNPLQLHLSTLVLPKHESKSQSSSSGLDEAAVGKRGNEEGEDDNNNNNTQNNTQNNTTTLSVPRLKFKKRETLVASNPTTTPLDSKSPSSESLDESALVSLTGNGAGRTTAADKRKRNPQQRAHLHPSGIRFELPIPPLYQGPINSTSDSLNQSASKPTSLATKLPLLDVSFLDTFSLDQINSISLYIYNLLPSTYPSLVYPALPPTAEEIKSMSDRSREARAAAVPVLTGLSTFLMDLLHHNNIISFGGLNSFKEPVVTKDGLNYTLKQPQDRAWALLLMYFDSIRSHNTNNANPSASTDLDPKSAQSPTQTTQQPDTATPQPSLSIPSLGAVFQFLFHLSFAPLGTALPAFDLNSDQLHVLLHLAEFGLLYPLYSTQVGDDLLGDESNDPNNNTPAQTNTQQPTLNNAPTPLSKPKTPISHGLLGFYPTRLLTNLSSSLKGTTFISASLRQRGGGGTSGGNTSSSISTAQIEETDDTLEALNLSSMTSYASVSSSSSSSLSPQPSSSRNGATGGGSSITEQAYGALIKDLATPFGTLLNPSKRFIIVETTLKVYTFTNNPLDIRIMSYFIEFSVKLPNLCVGFITRKSVQNAITNGISNDAIIEWLTNHAHEKMIRNAMGEFDTTLNKYKNNRDIILPVNVVNQINIWATEQERFECFDAVIVEGFPTVELFKLWESCTKAEELHRKLLSLHPTQRPKPNEYRCFHWDGVVLYPPVVLFKNSTPGKSKLILHKSYFTQIKDRFVKHQASASGTATPAPASSGMETSAAGTGR